jgi:hypothetical protein
LGTSEAEDDQPQPSMTLRKRNGAKVLIYTAEEE